MFSDFTQVTDEARFAPLPDGWAVASPTSAVQSTKAIAENRYKAVNMAGAAVIVSITNALAGRDSPVSCSAATASFSVSGADADAARRARRNRAVGQRIPSSDHAHRHGAGR